MTISPGIIDSPSATADLSPPHGGDRRELLNPQPKQILAMKVRKLRSWRMIAPPKSTGSPVIRHFLSPVIEAKSAVGGMRLCR
jgi:hypothetical protein